MMSGMNGRYGNCPPPASRVTRTPPAGASRSAARASQAIRPQGCSPRGRKRELWAHPKVVAVGEAGVDYYYRHSPPETQHAQLRRFVQEAGRAGLPLVIHCRDAFPDLLTIFRDEDAATVGGVIHCFSGIAAEAEACLALGFALSFSGIITFKNAAALRDVVRATPPDRLLIETDAPFLAPVPHRGRRNEPALVRCVAEEMARALERPLAEVAALTSTNTARVFRLPGA